MSLKSKYILKNYSGVLISICLFFNIIGCQQFRTVDGPETESIIDKIKNGIMLLGTSEDQRSLIKIITFPTLQEKSIKIPSDESIFYLSGPDEEGKIVYVKGKIYSHTDIIVSTINEEYNEMLLSQKKDVLDTLSLGNPISLSPKGNRLSIVKREFVMQIWDLKEKRIITEFPTESISFKPWFPDGTKIVYTGYIHHTRIPDFQSLPAKLIKLYSKAESWPKVRAIFVYDLINNTHTFIHTGGDAVISSDGKSMLFEDMESGPNYKCTPCLFDIGTNTTRVIDWPGRWGPVIAFIGQNIILYQGLPTKGKQIKTVLDSPLIGRKLLPSVKLVDLFTKEFQTVIDNIHPYDAISYGEIKK